MPAGFAHPEFLVETDWLAAHLGQSDLRIIDCTVHIGFDPHAEPCYTIASGREDFERGHIPGAQFVDVVTELSDPANPVPCMAPSAAEFAALMSRLGVGNKSRSTAGRTPIGRRGCGGSFAWSASTMPPCSTAAGRNGGAKAARRKPDRPGRGALPVFPSAGRAS